MAKFVAGSRAFDMTAWDLTDFGTGTVTSGSATEVDVTGAGARFHYALTGTGLGDFDANGFPQSGTVTGFTMDIPGRPALVISNISIAASDFMGFVDGNDGSGLAAALFSGNDSFVGRDDNLVLLGYGGNDSFNILRGGDDTIQGGDGNDTVNAGGAFTAADSIDGGTGTDKLHLSGDYSTGVTFGAATLTNVEAITLAVGHSYNLTLNAATVTSGQSLEVYGASLVGSQTLTLDGSAVAGDLRLVGGAGGDTLASGAGTNAIFGGAGNDTIVFGNWSDLDRVDGGVGTSDVLRLNGDFSGVTTLTGDAIKNIEALQMAAGHDYDIVAASNLAIAAIDCSALTAGDSVTFDGSRDTVTPFTIVGGAGNDTLITGNAALAAAGTTFGLSLGGSDTAIGGAANDTFVMGAALDPLDRIDGGGGENRMVLDGDYSAGLVLGAATISNILIVTLEGNFDYNLTENDANVAAGKVMGIDSVLSAGATLTFDGSAETDGAFGFTEGQETTDILTGGAGNDIFTMTSLGLNANVRIDGGGGSDTLTIFVPGTSDSTVQLSNQTIANIDTINTTGNLYMADENVAAGQIVTVNTTGFVFDGSRETDGAFVVNTSGDHKVRVNGSAGDDVITVSNDRAATIQGGGGADQITLGLTKPSFLQTVVYGAASESTGSSYDTVHEFAPGHDVFQLAFAVTAVDTAVTTGMLSTASFDSDLANAIGAAQLGAHHAVIFTPDSGTLARDPFLVIDSNGVAGYQAGQDLVIKIDDPDNFTTAEFTT